jgi:hypothetical protein
VQQQKVIVEMDSIGVVAKLNRAEQDWSVYGPLVEDIKHLLHQLGDTSAHAVRWEANGAAHLMAKEGC